MILSEDQILKLSEKPIGDYMITNRQLQNDHKVHIDGTGFEGVLHRIIGYENVEQFNQKKLLTKPFTRPLFKKIMNAQSRWKNSQETTRYYEFEGDESGKYASEFKNEVMSNCWKGTSIQSFVKSFLSSALYQEFNGFFVMERPKIEVVDGKRFQVVDGVRKLMAEDEDVKPYITFVRAEDVHSFKVNGDRVEWIIIEYGEKRRGDKTSNLLRVIDDKKDYIVDVSDGKTSICMDEGLEPLEHNSKTCPVVNVSLINRTLNNYNTKTSPVDDIIEILDYHLHQFAEHLVSEVLHAHPNYYQTGQKCVHTEHGHSCDEGRLNYEFNGELIDKECPACKGTGSNLHKDASTTIILPALDVEGKPFNISNVAGYVTPPVDILTYQQQAIDWMEEKILEAATGVNNFAQSEGLAETATGVIANLKPLEDVIGGIIDVLELVETKITDVLGYMAYPDKYVGCQINYGRKLNLRDENVLLKEIAEAKSSGASLSHIKYLNDELTTSRFIRSPKDLKRHQILTKLEPLIGYTFEEVSNSTSISNEVKMLKQNFTDLIERFEEENGDIENYLPNRPLRERVKDIREVLMGYIVIPETNPNNETN